MVDWREHVSVHSEVCHGQACLKGTRIMVSVVLDNLAAGLSVEEVLRSYPTLSREAVRAAVAYASDLARERVVVSPS